MLDLTGQVINNRETPVHHLRIQRKPDWLRARVPGGEGYERLKAIIDEHKLHTVCQEASCPNMGECWGRGTATIMILGDVCTRACGFCNIKTGKPPVLDLDEPRRVAEAERAAARDFCPAWGVAPPPRVGRHRALRDFRGYLHR